MNTRDGRRALTRLLSTATAGWGLALLLRPDGVARAVGAADPLPPAWIARVLGARLVVQHAVVLARPERRVMAAGAVVDGLHALSMVPVAVWWPEHRRAAVVSAASAAGPAALGLLAASPRRAPRTLPARRLRR
jgi:hypothetical protein